MSAWGIEPWANDAAANWFGETFDVTGLANRVEKALNLDIHDHHEEIRAAAYIVRLLARTYIWAVHDIDRHRALAANRLQAVLDAGIFDDEEAFKVAVTSEIAELRGPSLR